MANNNDEKYSKQKVADKKKPRRQLKISSDAFAAFKQKFLANPQAYADVGGLDLSGCIQIRNGDFLKELRQLTLMILCDCRQIENWDFLKALPQLTWLDLDGCIQIENWDFLKSLPQLTSLNLSFCSQIQNGDFLKSLPQLTSLDLSDCSRIQNWNFLKALPQLTVLTLGGCDQIQSWDFLKALPQLTSLNLSDCSQIESGDFLKALPQLTSLNLRYCDQIESGDFLKALPQLTSLDLRGCGISKAKQKKIMARIACNQSIMPALHTAQWVARRRLCEDYLIKDIANTVIDYLLSPEAINYIKQGLQGNYDSSKYSRLITAESQRKAPSQQLRSLSTQILSQSSFGKAVTYENTVGLVSEICLKRRFKEGTQLMMDYLESPLSADTKRHLTALKQNKLATVNEKDNYRKLKMQLHQFSLLTLVLDSNRSKPDKHGLTIKHFNLEDMLEDAQYLSHRARDLLFFTMRLLSDNIESVQLSGDEEKGDTACQAIQLLSAVACNNVKVLRFHFRGISDQVIKQLQIFLLRHTHITTVDLTHPQLKLTDKQKFDLHLLIKLINKNRNL